MPHYCPHCQAEIAAGTLVRKRGVKPQPRLTKPPAKQNARSRAWQAMRILLEFSVPELAATADADASNVYRMVRQLVSVGYAECIHTSSGETGDHARYRLLRDTGPHAPRLRTDGAIYDLNRQELVYATA